MGNCYATGSQEIETDLTTKTLAKQQKAMAGFNEGIIEQETPDEAPPVIEERVYDYDVCD